MIKSPNLADALYMSNLHMHLDLIIVAVVELSSNKHTHDAQDAQESEVKLS